LYAYYRLTEQVDRCLGRILRTLRQQRLEDNTLIVFTSDHGEGVAGHQLIVKLTPYDGAATVPLVIAWKQRIPAGREDRTHPVSGIDIVPTICDYAGVALPRAVTGVSLRPIIEDPQAAGRGYAVCELSPFRSQPHRQGRILRTPQYKYTAFTDGQRPEMLFDMQDDPGETRNLAGQAAHRDELLRHRRLLVQWIEQTDDDFRAPWMD
jgi:arylsulfatase A-like enzyme